MITLEDVLHGGYQHLAREMFDTQKCPVCHGIGTVAFYPMYSSSSHTSVAERRQCTYCFGTGRRQSA